MGLTVHYEIKAPSGWFGEAVKAKLGDVRQFALGLPVLSVGRGGGDVQAPVPPR